VIASARAGPEAPRRLPAPDPRARVLALVFVQCAVFVAGWHVGLALLAVAIGLVLETAGTRERRRIAGATIAGGFLFAALLNVFFLREGRELLALPFGVVLTSGGAEAGLHMGLRMANLSAFALAFAFSTPPAACVGAIGALVAPLDRLFGSRVHTSTFQTEIAVRFVPFIADEARRIAVAQRFRGLRPGRSPAARVRASLPLFVPVFVQAVLRADRLATLLAARGYRPGTPRALPPGLAWRGSDTAMVLLSAGALAAGVAIR
jgi:energy-coupling factor transport system permease protein